MLKKILAVVCALACVFTVVGCEDEVSKEIKIPIYNDSEGENYKTATVELRDIVATKSVAGEVGYIYAEPLRLPAESNILEYKVKKGDKLSAGDVIAVFDSSDLQYDYNNKQILVNNAYSKYAASGSQLDYANYMRLKSELDLIGYEIEQYTIKAPYDCVVTKAEYFNIGSVVEGGKTVCTVAKPGEVYIYAKNNHEAFATGANVGLKFGTNEIYEGTVVMTSTGGRNGLNSYTVIKLKDGEYERVNEEVGNIVSSGWATILATTYEDYDVVCIPDEAVVKVAGETYCYIMSNGRRSRISIELGQSVDGYTVVLSGLAEGDVISY